MCGIAGIKNLDGAPVAPALLERMTAAIAHRGPDGEGHYRDGDVGLGHRRLAIIDLSPRGQQPMANEAGTVVLTYNGELYNFESLKTELEALGHRFRSRTDSEVVLRAYEEWGAQSVERFNGMFAYAIYDRRTTPGGTLFLARDRYGVKPLYYYHGQDVFVFGSEIKALLQHPAVRPKVSYAALSEYFIFQNVLSDQTLFDGVRLLPAGCTLTIDSTAVPCVRQATYWDFQFSSDAIDCSPEDVAEHLFGLFEKAVGRQLVSDVPVGSYLSGGMDSGSITALAARAIPRIHTFTAGFDLSSASGMELACDERPVAELMANLYKTEHYEVVLHAGDMEHVLPELIWHLEDLRLGQCYPNYYVARLASRFVKVVLSGAGGDELFAGYPWRYYRGRPADQGRGDYRGYYDYWQRLIPDQDRQKFFNQETFARVREHEPLDAFRAVFARLDPPMETLQDVINASLYFELKTFMHGLFVVEDKVSMAHSLETRVPFMDNDLVDFALTVPPHYKLRDLTWAPRVSEDEPGKTKKYRAQPSADGKVILRQAMQRLMPADVTSRAKQGFSAPDGSWFRGESIDYVNDLLRNPRARIYEFVNPEYVVTILDAHTAGRVNHRLLIWSLLSFEWWLRLFLPS